MNQTISVHYYHSNALLVVNTKGLIKVLYTPFRALCTTPTNKLSNNTWVYVEEVCSTNQDELQYVIYGNIYSYKHFVIPIQF